MIIIRCTFLVALLALCGCSLSGDHIRLGVLPHVVLPEQRELAVRDESQIPKVPIPEVPAPRTVTRPGKPEEWRLPLEEAIRIALTNARVVRVLAGVTAVSSGRTIYDPAISNAIIDQAQAPFDPTFFWRNNFDRLETPVSFFDRRLPGLSLLTGSSSDVYRVAVGLSKTNLLGGQWSMEWRENPTRFEDPGGDNRVLNPENRSLLETSYTQPLLQGAGFKVNTAPIVLARIDTERSYFQLKDSVQELVRGVIEGYWNLVQSRVDVWARQIQVDVSEEAFKRAKARQQVKLAGLGEVAQARTTYNQFQASLIAAKAAALAREGALRNLLFLPAEDGKVIVPVSVPATKQLTVDWTELLHLSEMRRPDIIELKLILEADSVRLIQAKNLTLPRLDVSSLYRWNGLSGTLPNGKYVYTNFGEHTDWSIGINFSVPLGLRDGRARERQTELLIARDAANLEQGLHAMVHTLAINIRDLDNSYEQYKAFKETREAALQNLKVQIAEFGAQRNIYLNVLQALNDWGSAVTSEAQALLTYNIGLANLERQSGTILETHGLILYEEHHRFAGPFGVFGHGRDYPSAVVPKGQPQPYPTGKGPAENAFDLEKPDLRIRPERP